MVIKLPVFSKLKSYKFTSLNILSFMIIATVLDMGGNLFIKYISYFVAIMFLFYEKKHYIKKEAIFFYVMFVLYPIFSVLIGVCQTGELGLAVSQITPFLPLLLIYLLLNKEDTFACILQLFKSLYLLSIIAIGLFISLILLSDKAIIQESILFLNNGSGYFGLKKISSMIIPGVYFKATLFMPGAFIFFLFSGEKTKAVILFIAILLSVSKSAIAFSFVALIIYICKTIFINNQKNSSNLYNMTFLLILVGGLGFSYYLFSDIFGDFFSVFRETLSGDSETAQVRINTINSLIDLFNNHPLYLLIGQGCGSYFYSSGVNAMVSNIEIDHFNTIRKFGLIWSSAFYAFILYTMSHLLAHKKVRLFIIFLVTFILVGTNPLLINPLFLMILIMLYKI